jgi:DNA-binding transcriptional LysR family regulator
MKISIIYCLHNIFVIGRIYMNLNYLRSFIQIVDMNCISKAAEVLHTSQPALSRQLRHLENELGTPLFLRKGGRLQITPYGRIVYDHATKIIQLTDLLGGLGTSILEEKLSIGAGLTTFPTFLPAVVSIFRNKYPTVDLTFQTGSRSEISEMLLNGEIDIGVLATAAKHPFTKIIPLFADPLCILFSKNNSLAKQLNVEIHNLHKRPLITFGKGNPLRNDIEEMFRIHHIIPNIQMGVDHFDVILKMVQADLGATILPRSTCIMECSKGLLRSVTIPEDVWPTDSIQKNRIASLIYLDQQSLPKPTGYWINSCLQTVRKLNLSP